MYSFSRPLRWQALHKIGLVVTVAGILLSGEVLAKGAPAPEMGVIAFSQLPPEALATHRLIMAGGPFKHGKDGSVFGNRERFLPSQPRGYYLEYTVATPGSRNRGARRIICGGQPPTRPQACYYTGDHYSTFRQIAAQ